MRKHNTQLCVLLLASLLIKAILAHENGVQHAKDAWAKAATAMTYSHDSKVSFTLDSTTFTKNGQVITAAIKGVSKPNYDDVVAVYVPADVDPKKKVAVYYVNITQYDESYLKTGSANVPVSLINLRYSFGFKLISGGVLTPTIVAEAPAVENKISNQPTSGRLALHTDERSMVVRWVSNQKKPQQVQYNGPEISSKGAVVYSDVNTYTIDQMCGFPANSTGWMDPGYIHTAIIDHCDLIPGERYSYKYGSDEDGWSDTHSFLAPYGPGWPGQKSAACLKGGSSGKASDAKYFKFLAFNDVGNTYPNLYTNYKYGFQDIGFTFAENSSRLSTALGGPLAPGLPDGILTDKQAKNAKALDTDASVALLVGDLAYALGYASDWDAFGQQFEPAFTRWPLMVGTGNHERDWPGTGDAYANTAHDSGGECNVPYTYRFYNPANVEYNPRKSYYSFNQGPVHFLVMDSETPGGHNTPQGKFVAADLAQVDRSVTPWVVAFTHRMMLAPATYSNPYTGDLEVEERQLADFEDLFIKYQVDVVVSGHEHAYARTCPVAHLDCTQTPADSSARKLLTSKSAYLDDTYTAPAGGPVYMLAGHGGASFTHGFPDPLPDWVRAGYQDVNGYLRFIVTPTTLRMESVRSSDGEVIDAMKLVR